MVALGRHAPVADPREEFTGKCLLAVARDSAVQYITLVSSWRVIGLISGTSMDGIDVAAASFSLRQDTVELRPLGHAEFAYPEALRARLLAAVPPGSCDAGELCQLDTEVGRSFADVARHGLDSLAGGRADLVSSLGQTIYHWVEDGRARGTLQLGQPAWIAEVTGLPVVADLRTRDVAAGGHGAPLAAMLDTLWLAGGEHPRIALNIGGIANITVVGGPRPLAYDTGPGNALIDAAASEFAQSTQDTDGLLAEQGSVHPGLLDALLSDPYYRQPPPKSTGKEHFNRDYLRRVLAGLPEVTGPDLVATLTELTARTVAEACHRHAAGVVVASGGGVRNPALMNALRSKLATHSIELTTSDDLGLPASAKEAYLSALLGFLTLHGVAGTLPGATGADGPRLLGSITPGTHPLVLPEPASTPVQRLRVLPNAPTPQEAPCDLSTSQ